MSLFDKKTLGRSVDNKLFLIIRGKRYTIPSRQEGFSLKGFTIKNGFRNLVFLQKFFDFD